MVQRDIKEALDLGGVKVHGEHPVRSRGGDHVGHQLGRDGVPALGLPVLAGIAEVGDDGGDPAGGSPAAGIGHHKELHQIVIYGLAGRLDQKYVRAANGFLQGDGNLTIGESLDLRAAEGNAQESANGFSELGIGVATENFNVISVRNHQ